MNCVDAPGPFTHSGTPELFIAKNCPVAPFGNRVSVFVADAYSMSPVLNPVIPVVEVTMMLPSSDDIRLSSDVTDGEGIHSGTPDAFTDNTSPCVEPMASLDKVPAEDA